MQSKFRVILLFTLLFFSLAGYVTVSRCDAAENPVQLPEETVTADAEEDDILLSPSTVTVVRPQEMQGEQKNLPELLKRVPGLHIIEAKGRGAYTVASVRGSTAAEVSVFVDGVLMNLGSEAAVDLSTIPVDNVERIEVYRGYVPARFAGASMGGVINIITKKPEKSGGSISVGGGSYGLFQTNLSYNMPLGAGNFFFGANYERSDGDFEYWNDNGMDYSPEMGYTAERQNNGYKNTDILMKWNDDNWSVRGAWKKNDRELPYNARGNDKANSLPGATLDTEQWDFSVARRQISGNLEWGWKMDYIEQDKVYDDPNDTIGGGGEKHNEYKTDRFGIAFDGSFKMGENHLLEFLADYSYEKLNVRGDILNSAFSPLDAISDYSRDAWNIQIQDTISLNKEGDFWLTPIVRYNAADGDGDFSWGAAITKQFGSHWTVKASGGTYNRAPNLYEKYGDGATLRPNPALKWEDGTQWDIGATWKGSVKSADIAATLTLFGRRSNNLIEYVIVSPRTAQYINIGKADVWGVEFENAVKWDKWESFLSLTWMDAKNKMAEDDTRSGAPLPNRPEWSGLLRLSRKFLKDDKASAYLEFRYTGNNYLDSAGLVKIDNLFTTGIGLKYQINDRLKLAAGVDDIFNKSVDLKQFTEIVSSTLWYPIQGRTFYATLTWEF
ncbi:MAG: TonB-dependent receptor [Synergistaceae bacterium]|nr:TonB-dependent receptor [Synergistaceae bacterium]